MIHLTQSLQKWLWDNHWELVSPLLFGHVELFTPQLQAEYLAWCQTEEGRQYLKGGSKYIEGDDPERNRRDDDV